MSKVNILGVGVSPVNLKQATGIIEGWIEKGESRYVCVTGVHGIIESWRDRTIREVHNQADMVTPDGMPLVWISHYLGFRHVGRVYGPDLMLALCESSIKKGYRHFLYGGQEGLPRVLADRLSQRYPGLKIVGMYSPPFRELTKEENEQIVRRINADSPDIIWVGLSTPKQELWMSEQVSRIDHSVFIGVGAAFDFHAGMKPQAPPWMQKAGLEWFFRLSTEPQRLWRRYLVNNPLFVLLISAQLLGISRYEHPIPKENG